MARKMLTFYTSWCACLPARSPPSHAAVVARGMGKCCVSGCQEIDVSNKKETITLANGKVGLHHSTAQKT